MRDAGQEADAWEVMGPGVHDKYEMLCTVYGILRRLTCGYERVNLKLCGRAPKTRESPTS